jgi:rhodanese-related sulfurtransferase
MVANGLLAQSGEYPGREHPCYQNVPYIELDKLYQEYRQNNMIVVDVRSQLEFETIHIDGAVHIPLAERSFGAKLRILANTYPEMTISFYCNGTTCLKSYEAQIQATEAGLENTFAFDLGIPGWAEHYPKDTLLFGMPLSESKLQWISTEMLQTKMLSWDEFQALALQENCRVFDVRDANTKGGIRSTNQGKFDGCATTNSCAVSAQKQDNAGRPRLDSCGCCSTDR